MKRILIGTCVLAVSAFALAAGTTQSATAATAGQVALQEPTEPPQQPEPAPPTEPAPTEPAPEQPPTDPAQPTEPAPTDPAAPGATGPVPEAAAGGTKLKGCLAEGDEEGTYKLTNVAPSEGGEAGAEASGDVILKAAEGTDMSSLAEHIGSTVEVTGSWADEPSGGESAVAEAGAVGGGKTFTPASAQLVSDSCEGQ